MENKFFFKLFKTEKDSLPFCKKLSALLREIMSKHDGDF